MKEKPAIYKFGYICGAIFAGSVALGASALFIATVIRLIVRMF